LQLQLLDLFQQVHAAGVDIVEHLHSAPQEEDTARKGPRGSRAESALNQSQAVALAAQNIQKAVAAMRSRRIRFWLFATVEKTSWR
jgi:hypothetical protein